MKTTMQWGMLAVLLVLATGCNNMETNISRTVQSTVLLDHGSGVAIAPNVILTAKHVVAGSDACTVYDHDGNKFQSIEIIPHETEDAALVILAESVFTPVRLGTREKCYAGQPVYVVGTPYDKRFNNSVMAGVISSLSRDYGPDPEGEDAWDDIIQIDCRVNPGNSGGPVCTMDGLMIGIVSGAYFDTNITFVIPVEEFMDEFKPYL